MTPQSSIGPDLALVGAARSGTTYLASMLARHPHIEAPAVKEPNFFSTRFDRGFAWYDSLFPPRSGSLRLDASVSYSFPDHAAALRRLSANSPGALIVFAVRAPIERAYSHYRHLRYYLGIETARTFAESLHESPVLIGAGHYAQILERLRRHFDSNRIIIVPFELATRSSYEVATVVCEQLGIDPADLPRDDSVGLYRNNAVQFRHERLGVLFDHIRRSRMYPRIRAYLGPDRVRRLRGTLTRPVETASLEEALAGCDSVQSERLREVESSATKAVRDALGKQDARLSLNWSERCAWLGNTSEPDIL